MHINVTRFGKTLRMGFFLKIEFDAWLISSTIELTRVQVLGRTQPHHFLFLLVNGRVEMKYKCNNCQ